MVEQTQRIQVIKFMSPRTGDLDKVA